MADRIFLTGLVFYGYHGVNPEERRLGQRFVVDVELGIDLRAAGATDDLAATANYAHVYRLIRDVVEGPPLSLIEAVAERVAATLLQATPARTIRVRIAKPWAPVAGMTVGEVAIEILRARDGGEAGAKGAQSA
jgi:dihydroneopterin aldolase